jgi:hypothetical protein
MPASDWRVVATDNQARESVAEKVRIDHLTEAQARDFAERLNKDAGDYAYYFYVARHRDEKLWRGMEELV